MSESGLTVAEMPMLSTLPDTRDIYVEQLFPQWFHPNYIGPPMRGIDQKDLERSDWRLELPEASNEQAYVNQPGQSMSVELCLTTLMLWHQKKLAMAGQPITHENLNPYWLRARRPFHDANLTQAQAFKILKDEGMASEREYNVLKIQDANVDLQSFTKTDLQRIGMRRIAGYASIQTLHGLKFALFRFGPCVVTLPKYNNTLMWFIPEIGKEAEQIQSRTEHCVLLVGATNKFFIIRDVNGTDWGEKGGHTLWPYDLFGIQRDAKCILKLSDVRQSVICANVPLGENRYIYPDVLSNRMKQEYLMLGMQQERERALHDQEEWRQQQLHIMEQQLQQRLQRQDRQERSQPSSNRSSLAMNNNNRRSFNTNNNNNIGGNANNNNRRGGRANSNNTNSTARRGNNIQQNASSVHDDDSQTTTVHEQEEQQQQQNRMAQFVSLLTSVVGQRMLSNGATGGDRTARMGEGSQVTDALMGPPWMNQMWGMLNMALDSVVPPGNATADARTGIDDNNVTNTGTAQNPALQAAFKLLRLLSPQLGGGSDVMIEKQREYRQLTDLKTKFASKPKHPYDEVLDLGALILQNLQKGVNHDSTRRDVVLHLFDNYADYLMMELRNGLHRFLDPSNPLWRSHLDEFFKNAGPLASMWPAASAGLMAATATGIPTDENEKVPLISVASRDTRSTSDRLALLSLPVEQQQQQQQPTELVSDIPTSDVVEVMSTSSTPPILASSEPSSLGTISVHSSANLDRLAYDSMDIDEEEMRIQQLIAEAEAHEHRLQSMGNHHLRQSTFSTMTEDGFDGFDMHELPVVQPLRSTHPNSTTQETKPTGCKVENVQNIERTDDGMPGGFLRTRMIETSQKPSPFKQPVHVPSQKFDHHRRFKSRISTRQEPMLPVSNVDSSNQRQTINRPVVARRAQHTAQESSNDLTSVGLSKAAVQNRSVLSVSKLVPSSTRGSVVVQARRPAELAIASTSSH